jgi:ABC-type amino acid transport substrate-binding protein
MNRSTITVQTVPFGRKPLRPYLLLLLLLVSFAPLTSAQEVVPTLIPPTPVPMNTTDNQDRLLSESGVARLQRDGVVRVGTLYNEPPFGEFTLRGELAGYDADVARLLAETWGIKVEFVQVTRLNALEMLRVGQVDLLLAAQVHRRELDGQVEFSLTYRIGKQALLVKADSGYETVLNLANRRVGYVLGTEGEIAVQEYLTRTGVPLQPQAYLTLDKAYRALLTNEIEGIIAREEHLQRVAENELEAIRILEEPIALESFGIVLPRQDLQLRNLVNRTLHYLVQIRAQKPPNPPILALMCRSRRNISCPVWLAIRCCAWQD